MDRKILFLTGTRADFGKMKPLIKKVQGSEELESHTFVTGMHLLEDYGGTYREVEKAGIENVHKFINQKNSTEMDEVLSNTIGGLSNFVKQLSPDMIIVHGDRIEALAGALVGALNNILVGHVEGGEVSGTIDESIRHSVSKFSHLHFVANEEAARRLEQLGEKERNIFVIGSPDIDVMLSDDLPSLEQSKERYDIDFDEFGILIYHPVTTKISELENNIGKLVDAVLESNENYIVIDPNNDKGRDRIIEEYERFETLERFQRYPSIRFEHFLSLLKNANYIIGNSSAGIREAGVFGTPSVNIGERQKGRYSGNEIFDSNHDTENILQKISKAKGAQLKPSNKFGEGESASKFIEILHKGKIWSTSKQKTFVDKFSI